MKDKKMYMYKINLKGNKHKSKQNILTRKPRIWMTTQPSIKVPSSLK